MTFRIGIGYDVHQLYGPQLMRQLRDRCAEARSRIDLGRD